MFFSIFLIIFVLTGDGACNLGSAVHRESVKSRQTTLMFIEKGLGVFFLVDLRGCFSDFHILWNSSIHAFFLYFSCIFSIAIFSFYMFLHFFSFSINFLDSFLFPLIFLHSSFCALFFYFFFIFLHSFLFLFHFLILLNFLLIFLHSFLFFFSLTFSCILPSHFLSFIFTLPSYFSLPF